MGVQWHDGYSSQVDLYLIVDGEKLDVAQVGPESFTLRTAKELKECCAELVIRVDRPIEKHPVILYEGASASNPMVKFFDAAGKTVPANGSGQLQSRV